MLPHDVWYHYYDQPCAFCEEPIHWRDADWTECEECNKFMCEDCTCEECHVCNEKLENDDGTDFDIQHVCYECMDACPDCGVMFHQSCREEHLATCNDLGRAQRAMKEAQNEVTDTQDEVKLLKRKLEKKEQELVEAKKTKVEAKATLVKEERKVEPAACCYVKSLDGCRPHEKSACEAHAHVTPIAGRRQEPYGRDDNMEKEEQVQEHNAAATTPPPLLEQKTTAIMAPPRPRKGN